MRESVWGYAPAFDHSAREARPKERYVPRGPRVRIAAARPALLALLGGLISAGALTAALLMEAEITAISAETVELQRQAESAQSRIGRLETQSEMDLAELERIAREELGMIRPGPDSTMYIYSSGAAGDLDGE